jgi:hypothetical protein
MEMSNKYLLMNMDMKVLEGGCAGFVRVRIRFSDGLFIVNTELKLQVPCTSGEVSGRYSRRTFSHSVC